MRGTEEMPVLPLISLQKTHSTALLQVRGSTKADRSCLSGSGVAHGRPKPMQMVWHHLVFDEEQQIGAGKYTFTCGMRTHGMVLIRLRDGKIANWREYEIDSPLDWEVLVGKNQF
jgi:ketosteroid isomerase-like protein